MWGGRCSSRADDGTHGRELWKSDGTKAGTVLVKDINHPGDYGSDPYCLTDVGGTLFFTATDGTPRLRAVEVGRHQGGHRPGQGHQSQATTAATTLRLDLTDVGGTLFFTADDGTHGAELWKSDGTKAGTVLVKDINPGSDGGYYNGPYDLTDVGGTLFFAADDGTHGQELWKSDGTKAGTVLVKDINPGDYSSYPVT